MDISSIGARLELSSQEIRHDSTDAEVFPPGANISVSIAPQGKPPIVLEARIVWRKRQLCGVAFVDVPEESRSRLWNLLVDAARSERTTGHEWLQPDRGSDEPRADSQTTRHHRN